MLVIFRDVVSNIYSVYRFVLYLTVDENQLEFNNIQKLFIQSRYNNACIECLTLYF